MRKHAVKNNRCEWLRFIVVANLLKSVMLHGE
jgi:hypothetical protein